jgi:hypothetical protein
VKLAHAGYVSNVRSVDEHVSMRPEGTVSTARHALNDDHPPYALIAFDDLLWLLEFEAQQKIDVHATRIPRRVLELFVGRGLAERRVSWLQLTPNGTRALQQLI